MSARFRVIARSAHDKDDGIVYELFEAQSDADRFYGELTGKDSLLRAMGYPAVIVSYEEFVHGDWVLANRQPIVIERE